MLDINIDAEVEKEMLDAVMPHMKNYITMSYEEFFRDVIGLHISKEKAEGLFAFVVYDFFANYLKILAGKQKENQNQRIDTTLSLKNPIIVH